MDTDLLQQDLGKVKVVATGGPAEETADVQIAIDCRFESRTFNLLGYFCNHAGAS
jgi:hypothetical protein